MPLLQVIRAEGNEDLMKAVNGFIHDKNVIDIQYSNTALSTTAYILYRTDKDAFREMTD